MKTILSLLFIIISLIGITDAGYLTYEKIVGTEVTCGNGFDCGTVLSSSWAMIGPVPVSAFGLLFYISIFIFSILHFLEIDLSKYTRKLIKKKHSIIHTIKPVDLIVLFLVFGFLFTLYLIFLMAVVVKAWCFFCLISAATSTILFLISVTYFILFGYKDMIFSKQLLYKITAVIYKYLLKPIFFLFDPTTVHNTMVIVGNTLGSNPLTRNILRATLSFNHTHLEQKHAGITFPNKVGLSAGFDYNADLIETLPAVGFGFHTIGTVTYEPYSGNTAPQLVRLPKSKSIIVNKGLKNIGAKRIIKKLEKKQFEIPVGISIASTNKLFRSTKEQVLDITTCFYLFEKSKVNHSYYELNISCPNTFGGEPFTTPERLKTLLFSLQKLQLKKPVFVKMPIDQSERETIDILNILDKSFVAGVIFGNLTKDKNNPAVNIQDREVWKTNKGNLSGKPTWERSNALLSLTRKQFKNRFVIIGTGGIFTPEDAALKLKLGADLVQLITGMIYNGPQLIGGINMHLYLESQTKH